MVLTKNGQNSLDFENCKMCDDTHGEACSLVTDEEQTVLESSRLDPYTCVTANCRMATKMSIYSYKLLANIIN